MSESASRLAKSRTTVYDWVRRGTPIGWRSTRRRLNIPSAQILDSGRVVPGLAEEVSSIGDPPELAKIFLTQEWPFEDTVVQPLETLKVGGTEEVLGAVGTTFT